MKNWYTIAIAFLGGTALGLLGFLFIQPANSGNTDKTSSIKQENPKGTTDTETDSNSTETKSSESNQNTEQNQSSSSVQEEWKGETSSTAAIPHLIFYYKPG